jgi:hypothetical protein
VRSPNRGMTQPTAYSKTTNFAQDEASNVGGRSSVRTSNLDAEFSNIEDTLRETLRNLALIQRDDGKLRDRLVEIWNLSAAARAALGLVIEPRGEWVTATTYAVNDLVTKNDASYLCNEEHQSGVFDDDLDAVKWVMIAGNGGVFEQSGAGATQRTFQNKLRDVVYATDFMSAVQVADVVTGVGSLDVAAAVQAAVDSLPDDGTLVFPPGLYRLVCTSTVVAAFGNITNSIYRAVDINRSNLRMIGLGATILVKPYTVDASGLNYAFATDKNMTVGDLTNLRFEGIKFEFDPTTDGGNYTKRAIYFGGVRGIFLDDIEVTSSGIRTGGAITIQQSETVRVTKYRLKKCTQGFSLSYVNDVTMSSMHFDDFNEAIDFDRMVTGFHLRKLTFLGNNSVQAIDLNSCTDGTVEGVYAYNVPQVVTVNYKATTLPTYALYVATPLDADCIAYNQANLTFSPAKRVTLRAFRGDTVGTAAQGCINLGFDRTVSFTGGGPCEDITVEDVKFANCGGISIEDVKHFTLRDILLDTVSAPTSASFGALTLTADVTYTEAELSGVLENVRIVDASGKGIRAQSPTRLVFRNVDVDGFNTANTAGNGYAFDLQSMNGRLGQVFIDGTLARSGNNSPVAWRVSENSGIGAFASQIYWGEGNRIDIATVPTAIVFGQANTQKRIKKRAFAPIGTVTLTVGQTIDFPLLAPTVGQGAYICWASAIVTQASGGATNYISTAVRSIVSGTDAAVASDTDFSASVAAGVETDIGVAFNEAAAQLAPADMAYLRLTAQGSGGTLHGLAAYAHYIDYATT